MQIIMFALQVSGRTHQNQRSWGGGEESDFNTLITTLLPIVGGFFREQANEMLDLR